MFEDGWRTAEGGEPIVEYWKEVSDGYYMSNLGDTYSMSSKKILKPKRLDKEGHVGYCFSHGPNKQYEYQHRLMGENFIPKEKDTDYVVRRLNDIPDDNDPYNLAWGTQRDNWDDSVRNGTVHVPTPEEREKSYAQSRKPTRVTNIYTGETREYRSLNEATRDLGVHEANACKVLSGKRSHSLGWHFEYIEKD